MKQLRADITGLRAVAVLSVTVYHLIHTLAPQYNFLQGGFVGVDIFFVISGFLMTKIIYEGLENKKFRLWDFYVRRAKRICPALFVTVLVFMGFGYLLIGTGDLKRMANEAVSGLFFLSNFYFAGKSDYFANTALDQVFLHTWSLSVEWQFYMFYPLILMGIMKFFSKNSVKKCIVLLTVCSLIFGIFYTNFNQKASYFLLPSRAFELLFGALAYFYPLKIKGIKPAVIESAGLLLIVLSLVVVNSDTGWPTVWTVLPCFAAYLCIACNNPDTLLKNTLFQKLGLWSYSLYLVHWPIIVFASKIGIDAYFIELLVPIFLCALLLYYGFETRRSYGYTFMTLYGILAVLCSLITINGASFRLTTATPEGSQYGGRNIPFEGNIHPIGDANREIDFILSGDSFSRHYGRDIQDRKLHVITVFRDGCYSFGKHVNRRPEGIIDEKCSGRYANLLEAAKQYPDKKILIGQDWPRYERALCLRENGEKIETENFQQAIAEDLAQLAQDLQGREVYILLTPAQTVFDIGATCMYLNELDNPLAKILRSGITCYKEKELTLPPINTFLKAEIEKYPGFHAIDPNNAICRGQNCTILLENLTPVFQDGLHYSIDGSRKVVEYILGEMGIKSPITLVDRN